MAVHIRNNLRNWSRRSLVFEAFSWRSLRYGGPVMGMADAMAYRKVLQDRAAACTKAGFTIQAMVWTLGADLCQAAAWTARYGALEAEQLVRSHCRGE
jgi:hypothetical protein